MWTHNQERRVILSSLRIGAYVRSISPLVWKIAWSLRHREPSLLYSGHNAQCLPVLLFFIVCIRERLPSYFCCFQAHFFTTTATWYTKNSSQVKQSLQCLHNIKKRRRMWGNSGRRSTAKVELPFIPLIKGWILWVVEPKLVVNYHTDLSSQAQNINWGWRQTNQI